MANKQRQNYFDQMIRQYGEEFIVNTTADSIQKAAKRRIFREMIQGQIDYSEYGKYYQDPKFFENLLIACWDELQNNQILLQALVEFDIKYPGNDQVIKLRAKYNQIVYVYQVLYNALYSVKMTGYNIGCLSTLALQLSSYRNVFQ